MSGTVLRVLGSGLLVVAAMATATAVDAAAVAMVTDLQGRATQSIDGRARELTILADLDAGAQVQLPAGATLTVLYLEAGDEYVLKGPAAIVFAQTQPDVSGGARAEKRAPALGNGGRDIRIKPVGLVQGAMVMRSVRAGARIQLLNPRAAQLLEASPEFRWQSAQAGLNYEFELNDEGGATVYQTPTTATTLKLPANVRLREGAPYSWEVSARTTDGGRIFNSGKFTVASSELRAQAEAMRPAAAAPLSSRVIYAAWLDQMNLKDEARKYWQAAAAERPDDQRLKSLAE